MHFNSLIPEDFDKVAEIFAATVRHYNRGWADGYNWNIKYWEIWNEPEGIQNMWTPAEGAAGKDGNWTSDQRSAFPAPISFRELGAANAPFHIKKFHVPEGRIDMWYAKWYYVQVLSPEGALCQY